MNGGHVSGTAHPDSAGILALSIPYSDNWTCTVNGEAYETFPVNGIFTGIALEPGEYEIELHYTNKAFVASAGIPSQPHWRLPPGQASHSCGPQKGTTPLAAQGPKRKRLEPCKQAPSATDDRRSNGTNALCR